MKSLYALATVLTLAACAPQPAPPVASAPPPAPPMPAAPPPMPPSLASFDGVYAGPMILSPTGQSTQELNRSKCTEHRTATMSVHSGTVIIQYANWKGHVLHYRGNVDAGGAVSLTHTNSDGSKAVLTGQIQNNGFIGNMLREPCDYTVNLARR